MDGLGWVGSGSEDAVEAGWGEYYLSIGRLDRYLHMYVHS
jgi:hypothetical protein